MDDHRARGAVKHIGDVTAASLRRPFPNSWSAALRMRISDARDRRRRRSSRGRRRADRRRTVIQGRERRAPRTSDAGLRRARLDSHGEHSRRHPPARRDFAHAPFVLTTTRRSSSESDASHTSAIVVEVRVSRSRYRPARSGAATAACGYTSRGRFDAPRPESNQRRVDCRGLRWDRSEDSRASSLRISRHLGGGCR